MRYGMRERESKPTVKSKIGNKERIERRRTVKVRKEAKQEDTAVKERSE